jgi:asparagine synthase (glutamine-hydrolysing)
LRRLLERRVPRQIVERGKRGFEAPIGEWLRGALKPMAHDLLTSGRLASRGLFDQREVDRLWHEHRTGAADHRHRLWQLVMLELWFRQCADVPPADIESPASATPEQSAGQGRTATIQEVA